MVLPLVAPRVATTTTTQESQNMTNLKYFAIVISLACTADIANASSPEAWAELFAKAKADCTKAANLNGSTARGEPIDFEAAVLVIVDGRYQGTLKENAKATRYCLYDKRTGKAEISEAPTSVPVAKVTATGRTCWSKSFRAQLKVPRPIGTPCNAKNDEGDDYTGVVAR